MSDLIRAINLLINCFSKYAGKEGDSNTLTKGELKDLLQTELKDLLGKACNKEGVDSIFKELDMNQDNSVDFEEFTRLIGCIATICHEHFTAKK